jgi:hypothetical protein
MNPYGHHEARVERSVIVPRVYNNTERLTIATGIVR